MNPLRKIYPLGLTNHIYALLPYRKIYLNQILKYLFRKAYAYLYIACLHARAQYGQ
jgi:hypothetical protein